VGSTTKAAARTLSRVPRGGSPIWHRPFRGSKALALRSAPHPSIYVLTAFLILGGAQVQASMVIVPDDHITVQSGIDSGADTVLVRQGTYSESPIVDHPLVLQGVKDALRPSLAGLRIFNSFFFATPPQLSVSGINFAGRVEHTTLYYRPRLLQLDFSDCGLDSGFYQVQYLDADDVASLGFRRCRLGGTSSARAYQVVMESDTVMGNVSWNNSGASILGCWFKGGSGTALNLWFLPRGGAHYNLIEHYDVGIFVQDASDFAVTQNRITDCGIGVVLQSSMGAQANENDINSCGTGIEVRSGDDIRISNNRVVGSVMYGVRAREMAGLLVQGNIVGYGRGVGISLEWYSWAYDGIVQNNTVILNDRSGMQVIRPSGFEGIRLENNIGFGNREWGVAVSSDELVQLRCNDWFGNGLGAISGSVPDSTDLSVDPLFCDVDSVDVRLNSASALVGASPCGLIGALGVGCSVSPTLVQLFAASRISDGVWVRWRVAEGATALEIWVERSESMQGQRWIRPVMERSFEGDAMVELDRSAEPSRAYWYRLVALEGNETVVIGAPIRVEEHANLDFRLVELGPNPGTGALRIGFALRVAAGIEISVFDIQGRKVAALSRGNWPAGTHEVVWDGLGRNGQSAPAGMYVVRYTYPGGHDQRAVVRVK
jgi:parallel beta-helix repeat protein